MANKNKSQPIDAVEVYLERRKTRQYVGHLHRDASGYVFEYDHAYIYGRRSIPLGPDLPLSVKKIVSKKLFPTFEDRIPSKKNPAYKDYCRSVGIDPSEKDLLVLVATLGKRGPSSFIFSPAGKSEFDGVVLSKFRRELGLSIREFSDIFEFSPSTINKIEMMKAGGKDALRRLELYYLFPEVALFELNRNAFKINDQQRENVQQILRKKIDGQSIV